MMKNISKFFFVAVFICILIVSHNRLISIFNNSCYETETVFSSSITNSFSGDVFIFRKEEFIEFQSEQNNNKFIDYLPEKDVVELKMDLQYDKDGLINVVNENEFVETKSDVFKEVLFNGRDLTDEEILERLHSIDKKVRTD